MTLPQTWLQGQTHEAKPRSTKCLELPETRHTAAAAAADTVAVGVDREPPGGKTPNKNRVSVVIYHLLAARVGPWIIPKEPLPLTGMMHKNSSRRLQDTGQYIRYTFPACIARN